MNMNFLSITRLFAILLTCSFCSCGWLRAAGDSVESVGEGAGHAVSETGHAVGDAADETEDELDEHVY